MAQYALKYESGNKVVVDSPAEIIDFEEARQVKQAEELIAKALEKLEAFDPSLVPQYKQRYQKGLERATEAYKKGDKNALATYIQKLNANLEIGDQLQLSSAKFAELSDKTREQMRSGMSQIILSRTMNIAEKGENIQAMLDGAEQQLELIAQMERRQAQMSEKLNQKAAGKKLGEQWQGVSLFSEGKIVIYEEKFARLIERYQEDTLYGKDQLERDVKRLEDEVDKKRENREKLLEQAQKTLEEAQKLKAKAPKGVDLDLGTYSLWEDFNQEKNWDKKWAILQLIEAKITAGEKNAGKEAANQESELEAIFKKGFKLTWKQAEKYWQLALKNLDNLKNIPDELRSEWRDKYTNNLEASKQGLELKAIEGEISKHLQFSGWKESLKGHELLKGKLKAMNLVDNKELQKKYASLSAEVSVNIQTCLEEIVEDKQVEEQVDQENQLSVGEKAERMASGQGLTAQQAYFLGQLMIATLAADQIDSPSTESGSDSSSLVNKVVNQKDAIDTKRLKTEASVEASNQEAGDDTLSFPNNINTASQSPEEPVMSADDYPKNLESSQQSSKIRVDISESQLSQGSAQERLRGQQEKLRRSNAADSFEFHQRDLALSARITRDKIRSNMPLLFAGEREKVQAVDLISRSRITHEELVRNLGNLSKPKADDYDFVDAA
jgi:hypothetical protein